MSAANQSSFGFSGNEQIDPAMSQISLLREEEPNLNAQELHDAKSLELAALRHVVDRTTHELNNILTVIIGYADIALQKRLLCQTNFDDLIQIKKASEQATSLVRHLLPFSDALERKRSQDCVA